MFNFLVSILISIIPFFAQADYCDRIRNPDGSYTRVCGNEKRLVTVASCSGYDSTRKQVQATLLKEFDRYSNFTGSFEWDIQSAGDVLEIRLWAPNGNILGQFPGALVGFYPEAYHGKFSYTGRANVSVEQNGQAVRIIGNRVVSNLPDYPLPTQFGFILNCHSRR